ncbi:hypothetical protein [Salirhabdus sp. Marseille-P4669]|uniref:hypothetical protein n=1 Tax=Salirhabdus sp. Marseille-P4669 TaxID=2042310 RepID=UPI001F1ABE4C|nr:hypothetical protein [Salirhabdus sp. Marseille-P4669]
MKAKPNVVPAGMEYMELNQRYITTRGNISKLEELHLNLVDWAEGKGYRRDLDSYIVESGRRRRRSSDLLTNKYY